MKQLKKIVSVFLGLLAILYFATACDDMNDIQEKFTEKAEQVYLGKADSIMTMPGFGRVKLTWYIGSDPKIEQTVIYWNMRADSVIKDFTRTSPGLQRDSIIIENLPEGSMLFEFRNTNREGESSLYSSATATIWGSDFASTLVARRLTTKEFDYDNSNYTLGLSVASGNEDLAYSQITYTNKNGTQITLRVEKDEDLVELSNIADGAEYRFRNIFFVPTGMDTVFAADQVYNVPTAVSETGSKLSLGMSADSRFFERDGTSLYEWTTEGDLIVYALHENGSITKSETLAGIAPRTSFRAFFFHDDDKFIGINTANQVTLQQLIGSQLNVVKTAAGAEFFGTGFSHPTYLPAKGFFYSLSAANALQTWFPNANATWGSPNGTTVSSAFTYAPAVVYNQQQIVAVDANGDLWSIPSSSNGTLGSRSKIGQGWDKFEHVIGAGAKLIAVDKNGDFYAFDFDAENKYWIQ